MDEIKTLRFCFKIDAKVGMVKDEEGNNGEAFACMRAKGVESYNIPSDQYLSIQEGFRKVIVNQLKCDEKYVIPITLNEYLDNTEDDECLDSEMLQEGLMSAT